jgi:hypothetical protein
MNLRHLARANWDRLAGWTLLALGGLALVLGWVRVSDQLYPAAQLPYILSGGIGGVCLIGVGATLLISADLRDQWHQISELNDRVDRLLERDAPPVPASAASAGPVRNRPLRAERVAVANGRRDTGPVDVRSS